MQTLMPSICPTCGNNHFGPCATEETCFHWTPNQQQIPQEVSIAGSWHKWQTQQKMTKEVLENGNIFFRIKLMLLTGSYEYKYIVDGVWRHDPSAPLVKGPFDSCNNLVRVYPKKMFVPVSKQGETKISSGMVIEGLVLVGSWDNWTSQTAMVKTYNSLKACEENVAYIHLEPDKEYQFKFKLIKQYLIDVNYPTVQNQFKALNNVIITYCDQMDATTDKLDTSVDTPTKWRSKYKANNKQFTCKAFQWVKMPKMFDLPYERVQGHTMCSIGQSIYIFGGKCRNQFYNSLTKLNEQLTSASYEEALPNGRAFHNMVVYGNKIIIFGGHNQAVLEDYYSFNVSEEMWAANPFISGKYPVKKEKQSCVIYEMLLVFFGGYYCSDIEYEAYYRQISVLDIQKMRWIDPIEVSGELPTGRFAHTASLVTSDMFIFGGTANAIENLNLNDIWKINLSKVNQLTWTELKPKGKLPTARHGHSMNVLNRYLIIFGGQDNQNNFLNDVIIFNTLDEEWLYPIISGDIPCPRYNHASTSENDQILIFGGRTKNQKNQNFYILKPSENKIALNISEEDDE